MTDPIHGNKADKASAKLESSRRSLQSAQLPDEQSHVENLPQRAKLNPQIIAPQQVLQLQRTIGNQATQRLLQRRPIAKIEHFTADHIQREVDEELKGYLGGFGYKEDRTFMTYAGENSSGEAVGWKAHIGVAAKDKLAVVKQLMVLLKAKYNVMHKFDVNLAERLDKFVTIYPPADEKTWRPLIQEVEATLGGIAVFIEKSTAAMGGGKVAMRHGQIDALMPDIVEKTGIEIKPIATPEAYAVWNNQEALKKVGAEAFLKPQFYALTDPRQIIKSPNEALAFVPGQGAMFLLPNRLAGPMTAVIWEGIIRADPRKEPNPFKIPLPPGLETTDNLNSILAAQEASLTKTELQMKAVVAHVGVLTEEGNSLITVTDATQINSHNASIDQEYKRINTFSDTLDSIEKKLLLSDFPELKNRVRAALARVAALRDTITKLTRQLDVSF